MIAARALCEVCCRRTRLRRDGRLMAHAATVYDGHLGPLMANLGDVRCAGSGMTPGEIGSDVLQNCVWCG